MQYNIQFVVLAVKSADRNTTVNYLQSFSSDTKILVQNLYMT